MFLPVQSVVKKIFVLYLFYIVDVKLIYFDSLGAKSSCTLVVTDDVKILIDPGAAVMHGSFPAPKELKVFWVKEALRKIKKVARDADVVVITHYHYDHFIDFDKRVYEGKTVFVKNPNEYINDSQRKRAIRFFTHFFEGFDANLEECLEEPVEKSWEDVFFRLRKARKRDFGDYQDRRNQLLEKGRKWFLNRVEKWKTYRRVPEISFGDTRIIFSEGRTFSFGNTRIRFTPPLFHGIEYSRVGWVYSVIIEEGGQKLLYSSDLNGPIIEDYADMIIEESPDILILDGPMTYMLGYTLNLINFRRVLENVKRILVETSIKTIIYDHHLPREPRFKERTRELYLIAEREDKKLMTAAEYLGKKPVVLEKWDIE